MLYQLIIMYMLMLNLDFLAYQDLEGHVLSALYHVGQLVSCVVLQVDDDKKESGKRRVWLSLRLSLLHKSYSLDAVQEGMVIILFVWRFHRIPVESYVVFVLLNFLEALLLAFFRG